MRIGVDRNKKKKFISTVVEVEFNTEEDLKKWQLFASHGNPNDLVIQYIKAIVKHVEQEQ